MILQWRSIRSSRDTLIPTSKSFEEEFFISGRDWSSTHTLQLTKQDSFLILNLLLHTALNTCLEFTLRRTYVQQSKQERSLPSSLLQQMKFCFRSSKIRSSKSWTLNLNLTVCILECQTQTGWFQSSSALTSIPNSLDSLSQRSTPCTQSNRETSMGRFAHSKILSLLLSQTTLRRNSQRKDTHT